MPESLLRRSSFHPLHMLKPIPPPKKKTLPTRKIQKECFASGKHFLLIKEAWNQTGWPSKRTRLEVCSYWVSISVGTPAILRYSVVFLSRSEQIPVYSTTESFQMLCISSVILCVTPCSSLSNESVVKQPQKSALEGWEPYPRLWSARYSRETAPLGTLNEMVLSCKRLIALEARAGARSATRCSQNAVQIIHGSPEPLALCQETVGSYKNNRIVIPELMTLCRGWDTGCSRTI